MHSMVFFPSTCFGASILIPLSWDALAVSASRDTPTPGMIIPPIYCFLSLTTETVVAVPISITIKGTGYSFRPATAFATRSAPSCPGLSIMIFRPVFTPGPSTITSFFRIFSAASLAILVICGTTDEIIQPSISVFLM